MAFFFRETWAKRAKRAFQGERSEPWEPLQPILLVHSFPTALKKRKSLHKHQRNEPSKFRSSEASETSEMPFTFYTLKKWDSSYLGRLITLVFVDGFSISQRCWTAVDEETWLERFSRLASLALKSAFRSLRSIISANIWVWLLLDSASKDGRAQERALKSAG